jgi:hypothetical protein
MSTKQAMLRTLDAAAATRIRALEQQVFMEQQRRVRAEQQAAGYRSAVIRLQAIVAQRKADRLKAATRVFDAEEVHP